jgi:hypothetical protein
MTGRSRLTVSHEDFPAIAAFKNGNKVTLTLSGLVTRVESDVVDTSGHDGLDAALGSTETELVVVDLKVDITSALEYR